MRKILLSLFVMFSLVSNVAFSQSLEKVVVSTTDPDNLYMSSDEDKNNLFYMKLIPLGKPIGVLVILPGAFELVKMIPAQIKLHRLAVENNLIVVFPSLNYGIASHEKEHKFLDLIFQQIVEEYQVPRNKFAIGGFSGGGMIALSYAEKANKNENYTYLRPKAIFCVDPPLDYTHLWEQAKRDVDRKFSNVAVEEGKWILDTYTKAFGGAPENFKENYIKHSIYSHSEKDGGNAKYLKATPLLIYTEPDLVWQIENRQRDAYDINSTDISAMISLLRRMGNKNAQMISTYNKGFRLGGAKHPHSWSIMDGQECLDFILKHIEN